MSFSSKSFRAGGPHTRAKRLWERHFWRTPALFIALMSVAVPAALAEPFSTAIELYRPYMVSDIDQALLGARDMRDRIMAHDIPGAQKAWIDARVGWERSEVFTSGFVPQLDTAIDAWPDAVAGFHGIEAKLFGANPCNLGDETSDLILNLAELDAQVRTMKLTAQGLLNGIARLAYEIGDSKVDGGESRFSGTSLNDMRSNADGIDLAFRILFSAPLQASDPKLAGQVQTEIDGLKTLLAVSNLNQVDSDNLRRSSELLIVGLQNAAPKLGLSAPTLEEAAK